MQDLFDNEQKMFYVSPVMSNTTLEQKQSHLLFWVKFVCEEVRVQYGYVDDPEDEIQPPSWLAELEDAVDQVESEGGEAIEP